MGLLANIGRVHSQTSLYATYVVAFVFGVLAPAVVWSRYANTPRAERRSVWHPVLLSAGLVALAAALVAIARWFNAKVQSSNAWATFDGVSAVAGAARGAFKN